ncbi:MAG TPA: rhomboid family intramembrane serine protease [Vicinamibacterales bacterium]|nr:rhomboid family intramembrane serine protease [Vicinamibacterales bacterium]
MIPLRDVIPSRTTPVVTTTLIAINLVVFVYQWSLGQDDGTRFIFDWGLVPAYFSWVTVLSSMFLHGGFLHAGGNMLYLWIFGDNVEDRLGHGRFVAFYLLCGVAAALAQTFVSPSSGVPMVGASGAVAGVMGAYFVMYPHSRIVTLIPFIFLQVIEVPAVFFLGIWFLMQFLSGVGSIAQVEAGTGGIAFWAHVAGFVAGVVGGWVLQRPERQRPEWWHDLERR